MIVNPTLSKLGFGLSGIAGSGNFAHQQRLVETAIDSGITHFDVAPYYGSGDAEKILGNIISTYSGHVSITTKFGLLPFRGGWLGGKLRSSLRPLFRRVKSIKQLASALVPDVNQAQETNFSKDAILTSLDQSIDKLGRPLDIFLLHDAGVEQIQNIEVIEALDEARHTGRTTLTGTSGDVGTLQAIVGWRPETYTIMQLENSLKNPAPIFKLTQPDTKVITHRAIQGGIQELLFLLENRPGFKELWAREFKIDFSNSVNVARALIELAIYENPGGTVLFSTTKVHHLKSIASVVHSPVLGIEGCQKLRLIYNDVYLKAPSN